MARTGLLQQAQEYRYHLDIRPRGDAQADFAIVRKSAAAGTPTDGRTGLSNGAVPAGAADSPPEAEDPEVLAEIEGLVAERSRPKGSMELRRGEGRLGLGLPVLVTLLLGVLSVATIFVVERIFSTREDALTLTTSEVFSTESRLIGEILRSSEEALSAKEAEIAAIESRLSDLAASKAELEENLEEEVALREEELRRDLRNELEAERERLQELGTSEAEISEQLAAIEAEQEAALASQLAEFRGDLEAEYEGRIAELEGQTRSLEEQLQTERAALEEELARAEAQASAAQEEASAAQQQLRSLEERSRTVSLFQDQLAGSYQAVFNALEAGDFSGAREALDRLDRVFENPSFAGIPSIQDRQEIDVRVAGTIRNLIAREEAAAEEQTALQEQLARLQAEGEAAEVQIIEEQQARIAALEERNEALRSEFQEEIAGLQARQQQLTTERDALADQRDTLATARDSLLEEQNSLQAARDALIEERNTLAASRDALIEERDSLAASRDALIEERDSLEAAREGLAAQVEAQEQTLAQRQSALQERTAELRSLEEELAREEATVARLESRIAELESRQDALQQELAAAEAAQARERGASGDVTPSEDSGVATTPSSSSSPDVPQAPGVPQAVDNSRSGGSDGTATESPGPDVTTEMPPSLPSQTRLRLIGVVTAAPRDRILTVRSLLSAEPSEPQVESGRSVQIRRGNRQGSAALVGEGRVVAFSGGVIEIQLDESSGVEPADAVFVVME